ncbi:hypothetical protein N7G274_009427 [Stereocaulon virgatum]|uniref:Uncharacterized protein n=1 Tax=Stereocaulon virgatum TaxID=373712 RepID=A0ABR4A0U0_9LECA
MKRPAQIDSCACNAEDKKGVVDGKANRKKREKSEVRYIGKIGGAGRIIVHHARSGRAVRLILTIEAGTKVGGAKVTQEVTQGLCIIRRSLVSDLSGATCHDDMISIHHQCHSLAKSASRPQNRLVVIVIHKDAIRSGTVSEVPLQMSRGVFVTVQW